MSELPKCPMCGGEARFYNDTTPRRHYEHWCTARNNFSATGTTKECHAAWRAWCEAASKQESK